jgi:hypothetical protein
MRISLRAAGIFLIPALARGICSRLAAIRDKFLAVAQRTARGESVSRVPALSQSRTTTLRECRIIFFV